LLIVLHRLALGAPVLYHHVMHSTPGTIRVLSKAVAVIKACHRLGGNLSLGDLARELKMPRATVQRIVNTLVQEGMLTRRDTAHSISLSAELLGMGATTAVEFVEQTHPVLHKLARQTGETVDLSRFNKDHAVFVNQVTGSHRLLAVSAVGQTFPLHCTANGKAMLALLDEKQRRLLLQRQLKAYTPKTIVSVTKLKQSLAVIRKDGFATDLEEHTLGIRAIGMAFMTPSQQLYALSLPIPALRFEAVKKQCIAKLQDAVSEIKLSLDDVKRG
jgi:IclR family transcriptional regulator, acetate operon repressor